MGERPAAIAGNWGAWSSWSECSRSCGAGVATAERRCDNPEPRNGGAYCTGQRKRFRICNTNDCPTDTPSLRAVQCSSFDHKPFKGVLDPTWSPVLYEGTYFALQGGPGPHLVPRAL
ncbi:Thrombospondin type-1 (TSP1) repeat [Trinorchestia longiramus]|nr:Thrombospondin type-1 (TSP1) repeat [Trinorchestia longiramus]